MLRVYTFFDGQAVFNQAKACYGYGTPDYDPLCLAKSVVNLAPNRELKGFFFYTGVPDVKIKPNLRPFWENKLKAIKAAAKNEPGLTRFGVYSRPLLYSTVEIEDKNTGRKILWKVGREKGIDLRLGLDAVKYTRLAEFDVMIIFSQDSDFTELFKEIIEIVKTQGRSVSFESAFPYDPKPVRTTAYLYGIPGSANRKISKAEYDACKDPFTPNYWPRPRGSLFRKKTTP